MKLPQKIESMQLYTPVSQRCAINLDANESCFPLPQALQVSVAEALGRVTLERYPDPLSRRCCQLAAGLFGANEDEIVAGNGSDALIDVIFGAFLSAGDSILCCDPDFSMYRFYANLRDVKVHSLPRDKGLPPIERLIEAAEAVDLVILSNPCNPTGQVLPDADILRLVDETRALVVLDEAYMDFHKGGLVAEAGRHKNLIVLKTCSKAFAMAGIRLGFALAHPERIRLLRQLKSPYDVSALTQAAGEAVLSHPEVLRGHTETLIAQRKKLYITLDMWSRTQEGATATDTMTNFVLLHHPDPAALHAHLWDNGIAVRLLPGMLRITAGTDDEISRLKDALTTF